MKITVCETYANEILAALHACACTCTHTHAHAHTNTLTSKLKNGHWGDDGHAYLPWGRNDFTCISQHHVVYLKYIPHQKQYSFSCKYCYF